MGEDPNTVFVIGSPDIDIMLGHSLPTIDDVKDRYKILFEQYAVVLFHPVTTELDSIRFQTEQLVSAIVESEYNYIIVYPNNDEGSNYIFDTYKRMNGNSRFRVFPSIRFEYFLTLLKNAKFIIGNSSAGVREAPVYAVPTINIGTRQKDRYFHKLIVNVDAKKDEILSAIKAVGNMRVNETSDYFGKGDSAKKFLDVLKGEMIWTLSKQKPFFDMDTK